MISLRLLGQYFEENRSDQIIFCNHRQQEVAVWLGGDKHFGSAD